MVCLIIFPLYQDQVCNYKTLAFLDRSIVVIESNYFSSDLDASRRIGINAITAEISHPGYLWLGSSPLLQFHSQGVQTSQDIQ